MVKFTGPVYCKIPLYTIVNSTVNLLVLVTNKKGMMKYIGRYVRHPAVAESRITCYMVRRLPSMDDDKKKQWVTMKVEEFISGYHKEDIVGVDESIFARREKLGITEGNRIII